jgi:hypothetical protein
MYLSKGDKVILIKSTLSNLPTYFLSLFPILASVAYRIEKLQQDFLWGGIGDEFKYHLVSQAKVWFPISEGGLGICNLRMFNRALLGKWLWRFGIKRDAWWRTVVDSEFGCLRGGRCSHVPTGAFGVGLWKNVRKGWETFSGYTTFEVGDGTRISFWHDLWVGNMPLKTAFPALFGIAVAKDFSVANDLKFLDGSNQWNMNFTREAHDWEVKVLASFFQMLHSGIVGRGGEDKLLWVPSKKGIFKAKTFFHSLTRTIGARFP